CLSTCSYIAIDTEFVRERYYYSRLGIIQVASENLCAIIDTLEIENLTSFSELLINPSITKILHSCKEDVSIFYHLFGKVPKPIFDTQVAASFTGYEEQIGYAKLVQDISGVTLNKSETYTNWLQRPLTKEQIEYGLDDVRYLPVVYKHLTEKLKNLGRYNWVEEEFQKLEQEENYRPKNLEDQVKIPGNIKGKARNIYSELYMWREEKARELDRIRKDVIKDEVIVNLAITGPYSMEELRSVPGIFPGLIKRYGYEILKTIEKGKRYKKILKRKRTCKIPDGLTTLLTAFIKKKAAEKNMPHGIIARQDDIEKFIYNHLFEIDYETPLLKGWRNKLVGKELKQIIDGTVTVGFSPKRKKIILLKNKECEE
ncbi:MAG: HRDC domain-containing protein, partial [Candidatus Eremiobacterota bacterium]